MLDLDLENLPRAIRAMKCQALAAELAAMRSKLATAQTDEDLTPEKRYDWLMRILKLQQALISAQSAVVTTEALLEGALSQALADSAKYGAEGAQAWLDRLQGLKLPAKQPSPYTSDAEEKLARVQRLLDRSGGLVHPFVTEIRQIVGDL